MQKIGYIYKAKEIRKEQKKSKFKNINFPFIVGVSMLLILLFLMIRLMYF